MNTLPKSSIDLTGKVIGRLTVVRFLEHRGSVRRKPYWLCKCLCGSQVEIQGKKKLRKQTKLTDCPRLMELLTIHGRLCSTDAQTQIRQSIIYGEGEQSQFATVGCIPLKTFLPIWEIVQKELLSTESTTTEITNHTIADGLHQVSRRLTEGRNRYPKN